MQWNYQLSKQYYPVYELETVLKGFDLKICLRALKVTGPFEK